MRHLVALAVLLLTLLTPVPTVADEPEPGAAAGSWSPPGCQGRFSDVLCDSQFAALVEQLFRDGITSGCTASKYCPESPVTRRQMAVFLERAMRGSAAWPPRTQVVFSYRGTDGSSNPALSGAALLAALDNLPTSGADVPAASNPWLVKVGPGVYDLGGTALALRPFVTLEGSGKEATILRGTGTPAVVAGADDAVVRALRVEASGPTSSVGIRVGNRMVVEDVAVQASGGTTFNCAIHADHADDFTVSRAVTTTAGASAYGLVMNACGGAVVRDAELEVEGASGSFGDVVTATGGTSATLTRVTAKAAWTTTGAAVVGLYLQGYSDVRATDCSFQGGTWGAANGYGIRAVGESTVILKRSSVTGGTETGATGVGIGISLDDSSVSLSDSSAWGDHTGLVAEGAVESWGLSVSASSLGGTTTAAQAGPSFSVSLTLTRVTAGTLVSTGGTFSCTAVTRAGTFYASACP